MFKRWYEWSCSCLGAHNEERLGKRLEYVLSFHIILIPLKETV